MNRIRISGFIILLALTAASLLPLAGCPVGGPPASYGIYLAGDANGNALAVYGETSRGYIYMRKVAPDGSFPWGEDDILLQKNGGRSFAFSAVNAVSDGGGGFIVAWPDTTEEAMRYGSHLARFSPDGNILWQRDFIYFDRMISDGSGGVIIAFDHPSGIITDEGLTSFGLVKVDAQGENTWGLPGVSVPCGKYYDNTLRIVPDGSGGAIIAWKTTQYPEIPVAGQSRALDSLFVQRVDARGELPWGEEAVIVRNFPKDTWIDSIGAVADDSGGVILSWGQITENPSAEAGHRQTWDIVVQKIDADGNSLWSPAGVPFEISKAAGLALPTEPSMAADGQGGAIVCWRDTRQDASGETSVYAQRIDAEGLLVWPAGGVRVSSASLNPRPVIVNYDAGEVFISYSFKEDGKCLNVQMLDGSGKVDWQENGLTVADNGFSSPCIVPDAQGGVIVAWTDDKGRIYIQRLSPAGQFLWEEQGIRVNP